MDLAEFQGKAYFKRFGLPVSEGGLAKDVEKAIEIANSLGYPVVMKAQVQVGGRGKAGGVKIVSNEVECQEVAKSILGMDIKGHTVNYIWVEKASDIENEYYVSITLDRQARKPLIMLSSVGGVDIEQIAKDSPDNLVKIHVNPVSGIDNQILRDGILKAGFDDQIVDQLDNIVKKLYEVFVQGDCDLVEVNPLIKRPDGNLHVLDAKVTLDDDASFRHPEWSEFFSVEKGDDRENMAKQFGLNYIGLDGSVGVIANGAGLAMATCDVVNQVGGKPANFLDIGGGANAELMANALRVINSDHKVKAILINIFGGIVRCDEVAKGILQALDTVSINSPLVIRLDGTNSEIAAGILKEKLSDKLLMEPTMLSAAKKAVELAG